LQASPNKQSNHVVILNQVKFQDLRNVVHFLYHGEVKITNSDLQGFLQVGELLQVEGLVRCDTPVRQLFLLWVLKAFKYIIFQLVVLMN